VNRIAQTTSEHPGMSVDLFSQRFDIANDDNPVPPPYPQVFGVPASPALCVPVSGFRLCSVFPEAVADA
jgi:hypothetical protein